MKIPRANALLPLLVLLLGCSGSEYTLVNVSGTVTLDGQPLEGAKLFFSPKGSAESPVPGPRSSAVTDAQGAFRLETKQGHLGAVAGSHRVRITTLKESVDPENPIKVITISPEKIPAYYRTGGRLDTIIPATGQDDLRFDLESKPKKN